MQKWLRKSLVVLFTIMTFGLISPPAALMYENSKSDTAQAPDVLDNGEDITSIGDETGEEESYELFLKNTLAEAENQSMAKFGTKIGPVIENEFRDIILPKMEEVIASYSKEYPAEKIHNLAITEQPSSGKGEKIFHIYDREQKQDILRFHVRRDHPPKEGYWFNFHYHTHHDSFQTHYELGKIYWAKNTPPEWMN